MENYLDKFWFRLVLVLVASFYIVELGSIDSYATRLRTWDFYKEYIATVVISFSVFELVYYINSRLNKKLPWHGQVFHRLLLQIIFGWLAPLLIVFGLATLYFMLYGVNIMKTDYLYYAFPFVVFMVLLLNILFVMTPYFIIGILHFRNRQSETFIPSVTGLVLDEKNRNAIPRVQVREGLSSLMLETWEIAAVYVVEGRNVVRDLKGKEYITDLSMDELDKTYLPDKDFYRINRQLIAARSSITEFKTVAHYKIEVTLSFPVPVVRNVSQLKYKDFQEWIKG